MTFCGIRQHRLYMICTGQWKCWNNFRITTSCVLIITPPGVLVRRLVHVAGRWASFARTETLSKACFIHSCEYWIEVCATASWKCVTWEKETNLCIRDGWISFWKNAIFISAALTRLELVMTNKCEIHLLLVKWHQGHFDLEGGDFLSFFFFFSVWVVVVSWPLQRALPWLSVKIRPGATHCFLCLLQYTKVLFTTTSA